MKNIDKLDNLPQRLSMRRTHYKDGYDMKMYDHGVQNYKIVGRYIDRYLKKSVGKNYNKIKKHILEKMKDFNVAWHESNLVEYSLSTRVEFKDGDTHLGEYVIDSQGRLKINKKEETRKQYWINKKKEKKETVGYDRINVSFHLKKDLTDNQILLLRAVLVDNGINLGDWFHHLCCGGGISEEKYNAIINNIKTERKKVCAHGFIWHIKTSFALEFVESCFLMDGEIRYHLDYKTPEYKKWIKETQKQKDKELRERLKKREIINETLLHDIESDRKYKERSKNIVDRDRLGFDENSFMGEFYHGQKRKKRVQ